MPRYMDQSGNPISQKSDQRAIWYGVCTFWTDDWDKVKGAGGGIPVCPECGGPGFITTAGSWERGIITFNAAHPGYRQFIERMKEHCEGRGVDISKAWANWRDNREVDHQGGGEEVRGDGGQ